MEKVQLHNAKGWPEQVAPVSSRECPERGGMQRWAEEEAQNKELPRQVARAKPDLEQGPQPTHRYMNELSWALQTPSWRARQNYFLLQSTGASDFLITLQKWTNTGREGEKDQKAEGETQFRKENWERERHKPSEGGW